ncbi:LIM homeobox transcription factor 1-alpha [Chanos chanos]|uniref:LIM homeobox transcription factor 1-alpha n=1 Tax=Chanos chanos TaxID=29144 RepID=A0A6J2V4N0_CHACN|nr:LIM homeobox transcription factor 1-alpha-like [Chanos chanos]
MGEGNLSGLLDITQRAVCEGCHRFIHDRYLLRVQDGLWHERCMQCATCKEPLKNTCFLRDKKLYCKRDYKRLFAVRCRGCGEVVSAAELVMRLAAAVFHVRCFCCSVCACRLQKGDRCVLRAGRLLCARDYQQQPDSPATSDSGKSDNEEREEEEGGFKAARDCNRSPDTDHKRPKRPRTILTTQQRRAFKASFEVSSKPCRKVRETLAAETGLSVRVVQVWFQNQRAKMKKLARRQQQQQQQIQSPPEDNHDNQSHLSVPSCTTAPLCGGMNTDMDSLGSYSSLPQQQAVVLEQQGFNMDPFRQGLTPPRMPGDHMHPYGCEALYNEMDGDPLCHLGDCLSSADPSVLTPIDRLYSMQDSYFTS